MLNTKIFEEVPGLIEKIGLIPDTELSISTDSRSIKEGQAFLALKGENFDGINYVDKVLDIKPPVIIVEYSEKNVETLKKISVTNKDVCFLLVDDSLKYYQDLAFYYLKKWKSLSEKKLVIGITGTNGKTTNKEMLSFVLNRSFPGKVLSTEKNYNNHIGVPKTILSIKDYHDIAIVEMGTNHPGEILDLCNISNPDVGFITNIGKGHLEFFENEENVFKEKSSLYESIMREDNDKKLFVLNNDDKFLSTLPENDYQIRFSENKLSEVTIKIDLLHSNLFIKTSKSEFNIKNKNIFEKYNFINIAQVFVLLEALFPEKAEEFVNYLSEFKMPQMNRSMWINEENKSIFLDAYNANPSSMSAALESFSKYVGSKKAIAREVYYILGDMNELGDNSDQLHEEVGEELRKFGAVNAFFIGKFAPAYLKGAGLGKAYLSKEEFLKENPNLLSLKGHFFIKGSRSLKLEDLLEN